MIVFVIKTSTKCLLFCLIQDFQVVFGTDKVCEECAILTAVLLGLATSLINKSSSPEGKMQVSSKAFIIKK